MRRSGIVHEVGDIYATRDAYAIARRAGREWRPRNECGATVRKTGVAQPAKLRRQHKKEKAPPDVLRQAGRESSGDLLSRARGPGTIGDLRLNFRVRDGNGCDPHSITAETMSLAWNLDSLSNRRVLKLREFGLPTRDSRTKSLKERKSVSRAISTARLNVSPRLHLRPIDVVVSDGPSGGCPRET